MSLPEKEQCQLYMELDVQLAGTTSLGSWMLASHGVSALETIPATVHQIVSIKPDGALCSLRIVQVNTKGKPGEKGKNFIYPRIELREGLATELVQRGGIPLAAAMQMPQLSATAPLALEGSFGERVRTAAKEHALTKDIASEIKAKVVALGKNWHEFILDAYEAGMVGPDKLYSIVQQLEYAAEEEAATKPVDAQIVAGAEIEVPRSEDAGPEDFDPFAEA